MAMAWNMCAVATPSDPYAMQMVFVDEEGGKIEAIVQKQYMKKFADCMVEGEVYRITNVGVCKNEGKFRAAGHDYKLSFTSCTNVTLCQDFIGVVTAISEELNINREGRQTRLMLIDFVDEFGKIRCDVFGDLINVVMDFLALQQTGLHVVIIQFAKVNLYKGEVGIQNVMNASKILWNPEIPEAVEFKNGLVVHEIETEVAISTITDRRRAPSMGEEFLKLHPKKWIGQLYDMVEEGYFIILATITEIVQDFKWWYMTCSFMKAVSFVEGLPWCKDCQKNVFDMTPRYKVKLFVSDGNDNAHFILWDLDCYSLVNQTCRHMLADIEGRPVGFFPEEILNLVGKEMLFRIESSDEDLLTFDDTFKIKKVCFDVDIVAEYKEAVDDETPLKLKFAPAFTKIADSDANGDGIQLSTCCKSIASELEITPPSCVGSSSNVEENGGRGKRDMEEHEEPPLERKKRCRVRPVKVEKN
ncbi:hypothetical protein SESBI_12218 [Sesbania bispinosa]|nr:hypothetical protein SESBI_12218 [Sesbania bispinosa]